MTGLWAWYTRPTRRRWLHALLSVLIMFAGMYLTTSFWVGSNLAVSVIVVALWALVGTIVAKLIVGALEK